jgi:polysaccharide export outer membrane protein
MIPRSCSATNYPRRQIREDMTFGVLGLALAAGLSGCAPAPSAPAAAAIVATSLPAPAAAAPSGPGASAVISARMESLPADDLDVPPPAAGVPYRLGPDDVIAITVYLHPELNVPSTNGGPDALVTSDGTVELPLLGAINLDGLTLPQAQAKLTAAYATFVQAPRVAVQLVQANSLRYYLLGAFASPGVKYPIHPMTLLDALALGGSVDIPRADLYQAYVADGGTKLPVDLDALLLDGDLSQNIPLASGDAIVIPTASNEAAYVFGAVGRPGGVPFTPSGLSLLQALASAGLDLPDYTAARLTDIHIIRSRGRTAEFLVLNAMLIMTGNAPDFALRPGDILFVPPTPVATWNQVIAQLLPSLQTVSAGLSPFVDIKYLRR